MSDKPSVSSKFAKLHLQDEPPQVWTRRLKSLNFEIVNLFRIIQRSEGLIQIILYPHPITCSRCGKHHTLAIQLPIAKTNTGSLMAISWELAFRLCCTTLYRLDFLFLSLMVSGEGSGIRLYRFLFICFLYG